MGHFFISAAAAYGVGYQRRRLETRVEGTPRTIDELLTAGMDKLTPGLNLLLKTVPVVTKARMFCLTSGNRSSPESRGISLLSLVTGWSLHSR